MGGGGGEEGRLKGEGEGNNFCYLKRKAYKREGNHLRGKVERIYGRICVLGGKGYPKLPLTSPAGFTHLRKGFLGGPINGGAYN